MTHNEKRDALLRRLFRRPAWEDLRDGAKLVDGVVTWKDCTPDAAAAFQDWLDRPGVAAALGLGG